MDGYCDDDDDDKAFWLFSSLNLKLQLLFFAFARCLLFILSSVPLPLFVGAGVI